MFKGIPFCMKFSATFMPSFPDNPAISDKNSSHQRIGIYPTLPSVSQLNSPIHIINILWSHIQKKYPELLQGTYHKFSNYSPPITSSFIRTFTVGIGITPIQSHPRESRTITAGRELHPALKKFFCYFKHKHTSFFAENKILKTIFLRQTQQAIPIQNPVNHQTRSFPDTCPKKLIKIFKE